MTRRYTGAEALALKAAAATNVADLFAAAPDLADSLAAVEAERDALRAKVAAYVKALDVAQKHRKSIGTEGREVWYAERDEYDRFAEDALATLREAVPG